MKLISFDIGIKNMAYCIFDISKTPFFIHDWTVVNLLEETTENEIKYTCQCPAIAKPNKKTISKICGRQAKYKSPNETETYFCDKHSKNQTTWQFPELKFSEKGLKKLKLDEIIKIWEEYIPLSNERPKKRADIITFMTNYFKTVCLQPIVEKKHILSSEIDLITIGKRVKEYFDKIFLEIPDISIVLIENQISPIANRMKCIQGMLAQYFIMRYNTIDIRFISSSNKLKMFEKKEGHSYKDNKKDGVIFCKQLFETHNIDPTWLQKLEMKKKDDLADCFLQGIWFLQTLSK